MWGSQEGHRKAKGSAQRSRARLCLLYTSWRAELPLIEEWFAKIGDRLPEQLRAELEGLKARLA